MTGDLSSLDISRGNTQLLANVSWAACLMISVCSDGESVFWSKMLMFLTPCSLSLCPIIPPNTVEGGRGGFWRGATIEERIEDAGRDNDRMTDTAARGHWVQPVLSQKAPWDSRLDEASFKREMPERPKINWAIVNRLTVGGKRRSEKEKQQGAILCLSWKMSQTLLPHLLLPLYFLPTCQLHCHLMALLVRAGMGAGRKTGAELAIHRQTFTSARGGGAC